MRTALIGGVTALLLVSAASAQAVDPGPDAPVRYALSFDDARHHEAVVTATWTGAPAGPLRVLMSRSSPGRYAVHEFAKNVYKVSAVDGQGRALKITRDDPYSWIVRGHDGTVRLTYTLYADRADGTYSQVDATHAHLNMPATLMWAEGYDARPVRLSFKPFDPSWKIATQLPAAAGEARTFWAPNLQYLMDSPVEIADLTVREWPVTVAGKTYTMRLALHHTGTEADADVFADKLKQLVPQHFALFGEAPVFDFGSYTFLADYVPQASGDGMEHRNSTVITQTQPLARADFAQINTASHEFVHAWNVERIRPAEIEPFDFTGADPTPSLWLAEGFTQYYGPLLLLRAGLSSTSDWLQGMGRTADGVLRGSQAFYGSPQEQSLRAAFTDAAAAIDPRTPHAYVNYYPFGATIALALDLELRRRSPTLSLDAYMRTLWARHGRSERPYTPADLRAALAELTGDRAFADGFFDRTVEGGILPDLKPLLAQAGFDWRPARPAAAWLGASRVKANGAEVTLDDAPAPGSPLYAAGLDQGDRIVAVGRWPVAAEADWTFALGRLKPGDTVAVRYVQRGREGSAEVTAVADPAMEIVRYEASGLTPTKAQLEFRRRWLGPQ